MYCDGEHSDTSEQIVKSLAERMGLINIRTMPGVFPRDTEKEISNRQFSLVHIDVDVYKSAKDCFEWALPRLSIGGAVVFDDYGFERCGGVTRMVNELIPTVGSEIAIIHNLNGHAVVIKVQESS
jgi:O-methyltransferase